ncbi:MAG: dTDP-4-dehydrorhamnose reductase family protein [Pseudonocardia sp.]
MATLIIGASGLLGRALHRGLRGEVLGTSNTRRRPDRIPLNVRWPDAITQLLRETRPESVINAVGERRPAVWNHDPHAMRALNVDAAAEIARAATETGARLLHISTDYVFDGSAPPYTPDDPAHPVNDYGCSKLDAERQVLDRAPTAAILRLPVLYGPVERYTESNITTIAHAVAQRNPITLDHTTPRYPTSVDDVTIICDLLLHHRRWPSGVWHFSGDEGYTKYEIAQLIAEVHHLQTKHITPQLTAPVGRPGNCRLDITALVNLLGAAAVQARSSFAARVEAATRPWTTTDSS